MVHSSISGQRSHSPPYREEAQASAKSVPENLSIPFSKHIQTFLVNPSLQHQNNCSRLSAVPLMVAFQNSAILSPFQLHPDGLRPTSSILFRHLAGISVACAREFQIHNPHVIPCYEWHDKGIYRKLQFIHTERRKVADSPLVTGNFCYQRRFSKSTA